MTSSFNVAGQQIEPMGIDLFSEQCSIPILR